MSIEGRIAVDIGFTDLHTTEGVQSVQRIALAETESYATGKVAVLSGTLGTAIVSISVQPTNYRDASGALVSFSSVSRVIFQSSQGVNISDGGNSVVAQNLCIFNMSGVGPFDLQPAYTSGTASYTLVLYGT